MLHVQESPESEQVDRNDPNYDSGEEKHALAFHSRKTEQIKAYKQAVSLLLLLHCFHLLVYTGCKLNPKPYNQADSNLQARGAASVAVTCTVLCCAVLCCAVLCSTLSAVLCRAVLLVVCCAVLSSAMLCRTVLSYLLCCAVLFHFVPSFAHITRYTTNTTSTPTPFLAMLCEPVQSVQSGKACTCSHVLHA